MKKILATLVLGLMLLGMATSCTKTQYDLFANISGTVVDYDDGEPIAQALVTLSPGGLNTYTGDDGHFDFTELEAQQYTLTVQKTGYQANRKTVEAPSGETVTISITMKKQ